MISIEQLPKEAIPSGRPYEAMRGGQLVQLQDFLVPRFSQSEVIETDTRGQLKPTFIPITVIHAILS